MSKTPWLFCGTVSHNEHLNLVLVLCRGERSLSWRESDLRFPKLQNSDFAGLAIYVFVLDVVAEGRGLE